jgi:hypothetical protein
MTEHKPGCPLYDDDDWGSATRANYEQSFGEPPKCTCEEGNPPLPTRRITIPMCINNQREGECPFCDASRELEEHPELVDAKNPEHQFGCPLFEPPDPANRDNYKRIYGGTTCTCKRQK